MSEYKVQPSAIFRRIGTLTLVALLVACGSSQTPDAAQASKPGAVDSFKGKNGDIELRTLATFTELAEAIWQDDYIYLNHTHGGYMSNDGHNGDLADPRRNIIDASYGLPVTMSAGVGDDGTVGGGFSLVYLEPRMLQGMLAVEKASKGMIEISDIAGGTHRPGSLHFLGRAFDLSAVDRSLPEMAAADRGGGTIANLYGRCIRHRTNPDDPVISDPEACEKINRVVNACLNAGATNVYYPGHPYLKPGDHDDHIHCEWGE